MNRKTIGEIRSELHRVKANARIQHEKDVKRAESAEKEVLKQRARADAYEGAMMALMERGAEAPVRQAVLHQDVAKPIGPLTQCHTCGTELLLCFWDRPGGPPGNGFRCPQCQPMSEASST